VSERLDDPLSANVTAVSVPYVDFPASWPKFFPKDKMALFQRFYAESQELVIWNSTTLTPDPAPVYDEDKKHWTVRLQHDGKPVVLHPRHLVLATGWAGPPRRLEVPGTDDFGGKIIHTSELKSAQEFKGKNVVVVGVVCSSQPFNDLLLTMNRVTPGAMLHRTLCITKPLE